MYEDYLLRSEYGILASLLSVFSLVMIFASSAGPTIVNFAANYFAKNDLAHVRGLFIKSTVYYFFSGLIVLLIFLIFPKEIGSFFKINQSPLLLLCGVMIFIN